MYTETCRLEGKSGIVWIEKADDFAVIANKALYKMDQANNFAIVNTNEEWVDSVHPTQSSAQTFLSNLNNEEK